MKTFITSSLLLSLLITSCSRGIDQVNTDGPKGQKKKNKDSVRMGVTPIENPALALVPYNTNVGQFENSVDTEADYLRANTNSKKDIIYGVGAAGISFSNTMQEANDILSQPTFTVDDRGSIISGYNEGITVYYRKEEPKVPTIIWLDKNYLGELKVGGEIGNIRIQTDISKFFNDSDSKQGENFVKSFYNIVEAKADDYNCLETSKCSIKKFPDSPYYLYIIEKIMFLVSDDRKLVADMRLLNQQDAGDFLNSVDLLSGEFLIPNKKNIKIGATKQYIDKNTSSAGFTNTGSNDFALDLEQIRLGYSKSKYTRDYKTPEGSETLKYLVLYPSFTNTIETDGGQRVNELRLGDKKLAVGRDVDNSIYIATANQDVDLLALNLEPLTLKPKIETDQQISFLKSFIATVEAEIRINNNDLKLISRLSNLNDTRKEKSYDIVINAINPNSGEGFHIFSSFDVQMSQFSYLYYGKMTTPNINKRVYKGLKQDIEITNTPLTNLAGFSLIENLDITEIDKARDEATLTLAGDTVRISYEENGEDSIQYGIYTDKEEVHQVITTAVSDFGVYFGIKKTSDNKFVITEIATSSLTGEIKDLCQYNSSIDNPKLSIGLSEDDFINKVMPKLSNDCGINIYRSKDGAAVLETVYFPQSRLKLSFGNRELKTISIYTNPEGVK